MLLFNGKCIHDYFEIMQYVNVCEIHLTKLIYMICIWYLY